MDCTMIFGFLEKLYLHFGSIIYTLHFCYVLSKKLLSVSVCFSFLRFIDQYLKKLSQNQLPRTLRCAIFTVPQHQNTSNVYGIYFCFLKFFSSKVTNWFSPTKVSILISEVLAVGNILKSSSLAQRGNCIGWKGQTLRKCMKFLTIAFFWRSTNYVSSINTSIDNFEHAKRFS